MKHLSVALAVYNEESNLKRCLLSIKELADEIVIVDGGSTDNTLSIAKEFNAIILNTDNPKVFHINKKKAVEACSGEWILQIDADEEVTKNLSNEIKRVVLAKSTQESNTSELFLRHQLLVESRDSIKRPEQGPVNGYYLPRRNFFLGKPMTYAGMYPDGVIRLFKKNKGTVPAKSVHEQIIIEGRVGWLHHDLNHYSNPTFKRYFEGAAKYTSLLAKQIRTEKQIGILRFIIYTIIKPLQVFLSLYIRHKGILDGIRGFIFSFFSALHYPVAYFKSFHIKTVLSALVFCFCLLSIVSQVRADYVLPYPSAMPGSKFYKLSLFIDTLQSYWVWGSIARFRFNLAQADKYLVQSKTLFEYKQYLLGSEGLKTSINYIGTLQAVILNAYSEGKDIKPTITLYAEALKTHIKVLEELKGKVPQQVTWTPEHEAETVLNLHTLIDEAILLHNSELMRLDIIDFCINTSSKPVDGDGLDECLKSQEKLKKAEDDLLLEPDNSSFRDEEPYL